jgi:hypothetical protein
MAVLAQFELPVRLADSGLLLAVASVSVNDAVRLPPAPGAKLTVTVQEPVVMVEVHPQRGSPPVHVKSPGFVPPKLSATFKVEPDAPVLLKTVVPV